MKRFYKDKLEFQDFYYDWDRQEAIDFLKEYLDEKNISNPTFTNVLELGSANGKTCQAFKQKFPTENYIGIELIEEAAEKSKAYLDHVYCADIEKMVNESDFGTLEETQYDLILCLDVLEHMVDPWSVLDQLRKWIVPDGILLTSLPNAGHRKMVDSLLNDTLQYEDRGLLDVTHLRFFTKSTIEQMLNSSGFQVEKIGSLYDAVPLKRKVQNSMTLRKNHSLDVHQYMHISSPGKVTANSIRNNYDENMLRVFFGHHKCASTWTTLLIEKICIELGIKYGIAYQKEIDRYGSVQGYIDNTGIRFLIIPEAGYEKAQQITEPYRGFNLIRDPRDVIVSAYFSHRHSHPTEDFEELALHRQELQGMNKHEGLMEEMKFCAPYLQNMMSWDYNDPSVLQLKYEEMIDDPLGTFEHVFRFLNLLDQSESYQSSKVKRFVNRVNNRLQTARFNFTGAVISKERLNELLNEISFKKLTKGRQEGQEDVKSHYRKGIANDWVNHFKEDHKNHLQKLYPELLEKTGY